jgi:hypothetical protein
VLKWPEAQVVFISHVDSGLWLDVGHLNRAAARTLGFEVIAVRVG